MSSSGANTCQNEKAAMPRDCYFALHSSIERRVRRKTLLHNTNTSVSFHIHEKWFIIRTLISFFLKRCWISLINVNVTDELLN